MRVKKTEHVITQIRTHKGRLAVGRAGAENHKLRRDGIEFNGDFAPIDLELVAWRMVNRNKDFRGDQFTAELFDEIADGSPGNALLVLVSQSFANAHCSVTLLARSLQVVG